MGVIGGHISTSIWAMGMAIYGGNRRPDIGHGHDYMELIEGYISI